MATTTSSPPNTQNCYSPAENTTHLGTGYAALVLALGQLLGRNRSSLGVAGATLTAAALFQPLRRRVQQVVDRRFDRRRYDAARTIEGFSARLSQEVDLDMLSGELLGVVDQTMEPTTDIAALPMARVGLLPGVVTLSKGSGRSGWGDWHGLA
jgi:hypothetical protein